MGNFCDDECEISGIKIHKERLRGRFGIVPQRFR